MHDAKLLSKMLTQFTPLLEGWEWAYYHTVPILGISHPKSSLISLLIIIMSIKLAPVGSVLCKHCHIDPHNSHSYEYLHRWGNWSSKRLRIYPPLLKSRAGTGTQVWGLIHSFHHSISQSILSLLGRLSTFLCLLAINKFTQEMSVQTLFTWKH